MEPPSTDDLRRWGAPLTKRPANLENVRNRSVLSQRAANSAALSVNCILPERTLLDLSSDIQEQILFLPLTKGLNERNLRPLAQRIDWHEQRRLFEELISRLGKSGFAQSWQLIVALVSMTNTGHSHLRKGETVEVQRMAPEDVCLGLRFKRRVRATPPSQYPSRALRHR